MRKRLCLTWRDEWHRMDRPRKTAEFMGIFITNTNARNRVEGCEHYKRQLKEPPIAILRTFQFRDHSMHLRMVRDLERVQSVGTNTKA